MGGRRTLHILRLMTLASLVGGCCLGAAQQAGGATEASSTESLRDVVRDLQQQVRELQGAVAEMREENERARADSAELRSLLGQMRGESAESQVSKSARPGAPTAAAEYALTQDQERKSERAASLEEKYELLTGKVDDQYQTKVESASKYRVRLSGIVLINAFNNKGTVDSIDVPSLTYATTPGFANGSLGATLRQSEVGLEVFGPQLAGAKTRADQPAEASQHAAKAAAAALTQAHLSLPHVNAAARARYTT